MKQRRGINQPDASAVGWISLSDTWLLTTVLGFCIAVCFSAGANKAEKRTLDVEMEKEKAGKEIAELKEAIVAAVAAQEDAAKAKAKTDAERELGKSEKAKRKRALLAQWKAEAKRKSALLAHWKAEAKEAKRMAAQRESALAAQHESALAAQRESALAAQRESALAAQRESALLAQRKATAKDLRDTEREVARLEGELDLRRSGQGKVRQDLMGLRGSLDRVVFVFDRSGSMKKDGRWETVKATAKVWLDYLPVKEGALVVFSDDVISYPVDNHLVNMQDPTTRKKMGEWMDDLEPEGKTRTLHALEKAYRYPGIDAIVLFTDGAPTKSYGSRNEIHKFVENEATAGRKPRIHTVGLSDYFDKNLGRFLRRLAKETDGTFIGR